MLSNCIESVAPMNIHLLCLLSPLLSLSPDKEEMGPNIIAKERGSEKQINIFC